MITMKNGDTKLTEAGAGAATVVHTNKPSAATNESLESLDKLGHWPQSTWFQERLKLIYRLKAEGKFYGYGK